MKARVYSYIRFSDAKQAAGASVDRQSAYAAKWAAEHGLLLDDELSMRDEGLSAFHQRHVKKGALGVFLRAVEDGKVPPHSVLIVEGLDRLSRADPIDAQAQLTSIITAGISVVTAEDNRVYNRANLKANPFDLIHSLLKMIRANEESETKSRRVRDALRRQCQDWISGKSRRLIRFGNTPGWLRAVGGKWELIPERAGAVLLAIDMFQKGLGAGYIANHLSAAGLSVSNGEPNSGHIVRMLTQRALMGEKRIELDGETFILEGYFPALLDAEAFEELRLLAESRGSRTRRGVKGAIPSLLTGMGITFCGYCGSPLKSQTAANKMRPDGTLDDCQRRLQCVRVNTGGGCVVKGSCSSAPVERALMRYCSIWENLERLYGPDRSAAPHSALLAARLNLEKIDKALQRITDALMESDAPSSTFTKKARELEEDRARTLEQIKAAEVAIAETTRTGTSPGADTLWRALIEGVERLDYEQRMRARQLVTDTFERIEIYHHGIVPGDTPKGMIDVMLLAKGGVERLLRIDRKGAWEGEDNIFNVVEEFQPLAARPQRSTSAKAA